jgi:hypothetical protein
VGAPVQLQIPFAARQMNPSCLTTGHPPPLTGALQKGGNGIWNSMKNAAKKVTNTVGITRKNNTGANNLARLGNAYTVTNVNLPPNNGSNIGSNTNTVANNNNASNYSNYTEYGNQNSVGGKRRKNKKSRKSKGRKH